MSQFEMAIDALATQHESLLDQIVSEDIKLDELEAAISNADWAAVTTACEADTSKKGKIGPVYSGLTAMELWANTYSDRKQSVKTQRMLAEAEIVNKVREYVGGVACKGTGECLKAERGRRQLAVRRPRSAR